MIQSLFRYPDPSENFEIQIPFVPIFYGNKRQRNLSFFIWIALLVVIIGITAFMANSLTNGSFFSLKMFSLIQLQWLPVALLALSSSILFNRGGFDWSYGVVITLSGLIAASSLPGSTLLAIMAALSVGLMNGALVGIMRYPGLLITFGTSFIVNAIMFSIFNQPIQTKMISEGVWGAVGWILFILFLCAALLWIQFPILENKRMEWASSRVNRIFDLGLPYLLSSLTAGLTGIYITARIHTATPVNHSDFPFQAFLLIMLSGSLIATGYINIIGVALASLLFVLFKSAVMHLIDPSAYVRILGISFFVFIVLNHLYHMIFGYIAARKMK